VVVPWIVRNYYAVGAPSISTNTGINLFIGNQPGSGMGYNRDIANRFDLDTMPETYVDSVAWHEAWDYIFKNPGTFVKRGFLKVGFLYAVDFDALQYGLIVAAEESKANYAVYMGLLSEMYYLIVLLSAVLGIVFYCTYRQIRSPGGHLLLMTILYWTAVHFLFHGKGRYHFPIVFILAAFAGLFIVHQLRLSEFSS